MAYVEGHWEWWFAMLVDMHSDTPSPKRLPDSNQTFSGWSPAHSSLCFGGWLFRMYTGNATTPGQNEFGGYAYSAPAQAVTLSGFGMEPVNTEVMYSCAWLPDGRLAATLVRWGGSDRSESTTRLVVFDQSMREESSRPFDFGTEVMAATWNGELLTRIFSKTGGPAGYAIQGLDGTGTPLPLPSNGKIIEVLPPAP